MYIMGKLKDANFMHTQYFMIMQLVPKADFGILMYRYYCRMHAFWYIYSMGSKDRQRIYIYILELIVGKDSISIVHACTISLILTCKYMNEKFYSLAHN